MTIWSFILPRLVWLKSSFDNTLPWYSSDNGTPIPKSRDPHNGGFRGNKGSLYEGGLRVPTIVEWPAVIRRHRVSTVPRVGSDIFPTLLDLLGLQSSDPQRPIDGVSLWHLIVDDSMKERPQPQRSRLQMRS